MKTRQELIKAMEQVFIDGARPECVTVTDSNAIAAKMFDALLNALPYCMVDDPNLEICTNAMYYDLLMAMERQ